MSTTDRDSGLDCRGLDGSKEDRGETRRTVGGKGVVVDSSGKEDPTLPSPHGSNLFRT